MNMNFYTADEASREWGQPRWQVIEIFKKLDRQGIATFKTGRKGWPTRLERR